MNEFVTVIKSRSCKNYTVNDIHTTICSQQAIPWNTLYFSLYNNSYYITEYSINTKVSIAISDNLAHCYKAIND